MKKLLFKWILYKKSQDCVEATIAILTLIFFKKYSKQNIICELTYASILCIGFYA